MEFLTDMSDRFAIRGFKSYQPNQYQLLTVKDLQKDEAAIIEVLYAIKNKELRNDMVLLNYYKELPISFGATVESIERGVVDVKVHRLQTVAMMLQHMTFIKSDHLPYCVIAKVLKAKKEQDIALLTQFSYASVPSEQRKYVRVSVHDKVEALFSCDQHLLRGKINDISYGGVAIIAPREDNLYTNAKGMATLWLPAATLEIPGVLLRIEEQHSSVKYIVRLDMDPKNEIIISKFIFGQQIMILRELKDMCG